MKKLLTIFGVIYLGLYPLVNDAHAENGTFANTLFLNHFNGTNTTKVDYTKANHGHINAIISEALIPFADRI